MLLHIVLLLWTLGCIYLYFELEFSFKGNFNLMSLSPLPGIGGREYEFALMIKNTVWTSWRRHGKGQWGTLFCSGKDGMTQISSSGWPPLSGALSHQMWGRGSESGTSPSCFWLPPFAYSSSCSTKGMRQQHVKGNRIKNNKRNLKDRKTRIDNELNLVRKSSTGCTVPKGLSIS